MQSRMRDLTRTAQSIGLVVKENYMNKGHVILLLVAPNGVERVFSAAGILGDIRGDKNMASDWKRFFRENPAPPETALSAALKKTVLPEFKTVHALKAPQVQVETPEVATTISEPPKEPTVIEEKAARKNNKVGQVRFYAICEWLKKADLKGIPTNVVLAERISAGVGFEVGVSTVTDALLATGLVLPDRPTIRKAKPSEAQAILAREIIRVLNERQMEVPDDLKGLADAS